MKRVLIVRTDRIGDVIMITPMIREIRKRYPDAFIATLTQPYTNDIFLHNPHVNACITDDLTKETFWSIVKELRSHHFSDGLLVLPTERATYQMFLAGIWNRIGVGHRLYSVITFMKGVSRNNYIPLRHEADYCMDLARKIGITTTDIAPEIFVTDEEKRERLLLLQKKGALQNDTKIFIHTGTQGSSPNWSESQYSLLIKSLLVALQESTVKIILTAREMTMKFLDEVVSHDCNRVINIAEDIHNVRELITSIAVADLVITPSTGPEHIADALNVRCIGLHCHRPMNSVQYWGILNKRSINMEVSDDYCNRHCSADQNTCAIEHGIAVDDVIQNVKRLLNR